LKKLLWRAAFLRSAYFMQNFSTTLHDDLVSEGLIFLPERKAKFRIIDVVYIGEVVAKILIDTPIIL
jgi:hypothetical protein